MEQTHNLIFDEIRKIINKSELMWIAFMLCISFITCTLCMTGIFPVYALWSLLWIIPNIIALVLTVHYYQKKAAQLDKKQQISTMAYHAKQVIDELNKKFPDTYINDCNIKMQYLAQNGVDVAFALRRLNNNVEVYNELVLAFLRESDRLEDELYDLMQPETLMQYGSKAHTIRGKAYELGLTNLTDTAFFHEIEAYAGSIEVLRDNWKKLSFELDEAYDTLSEYIRSFDLTNNITFKKWGEQLEEAFEALETYDTLKAKKILNELIKYQIDSDITKTLENIITNIDEMIKT